MTEKTIGNGPIDHEFQEIMAHVARALDALFNGDVPLGERTTGFILLAFPFGPGGRYNVVSNGINDNDALTVFKEVIVEIEDSLKQGS